MDPSSSKGLISTMSKKWKLEQIPTKKLELENKLMEERLNQLKNELLNDKQKRSAQGGTIWSKGQIGPMTNYVKSVKGNENESVLTKLTNRQMKLKILVDEAAAAKTEAKTTTTTMTLKDKRTKCGQCEKKIAFTRCLECCEDYCANCFTDFHMKGALQKHRALPINTNNSETANSQKLSEAFNEFQREVYKQQPLMTENSFNNNYSICEEKTEPSSRMMSAETRKIKTLIEPLQPDVTANNLLNGSYDEKEAQDSFKKAVMEWRFSKQQDSTLSLLDNKSDSTNNLLNGTYDEREAQESFKKAVMEWRNSKPPVNTPQTSTRSIKRDVEIKANRNAAIGTDNSGLNTDRSANHQIKILENQINSNHTLTYAERCLVHKFRRNDLNFTENNSGINVINEKLILTLDINSPRQQVSNNTNKSLKLSNSIDSSIKLNKSNENLSGSVNQTPILIEEVAQSVNLVNKSIITANCKLKKIEPELIESTIEINDKISVSKSYTRPDSVSLNRPKTPGSRPQSSRPQSSLRKSIVFESNLCRNTSEELKKITQRNVSLDEKINENQNDLGAFLMLDVEKDKSNDDGVFKNSKETLVKNELLKVSHMLYEMSPRSWKPSLSLVASNLAKDENNNHDEKTRIQEQFKLAEKIDEKDSDENSKLKTNINSTELKIMPNQNVNIVKSKKTLVSNNLRSSSSIGLKHKSLDTKNKEIQIDRKDFNRNKSFVGSEKIIMSKSAQKRAISAAGNYALSNIVNIELGKQFGAYDIDDGRSSRICQNEEDETYFGALEKEFKAKTPRKSESTVKKSTEFENINLNELNEKVLKNLSTGLEYSIRNEEFSDTEMENLTLEELKSLR